MKTKRLRVEIDYEDDDGKLVEGPRLEWTSAQGELGVTYSMPRLVRLPDTTTAFTLSACLTKEK
jgi:hypothetical protein